MSCIIAVAGKGGVGKTTISVFLIRYLAKIDRPVLAVDADPNSNLNIQLGFEYENTIADIREETKNLSSAGLSRSDFFDLRLQEIVVEGEGVDLVVMGRPEGPGCYCAVNNMLRDYLLKLNKNYRFVVIDNEAGMEHLSRRTTGTIDRLILVSDVTKVGISSAINIFKTAKKAGLKIKDALVLINKSTGGLPEDKTRLIKEAGLNIGGYVPFQEEIERNSERGEQIAKTQFEDLDTIFDNSLGVRKK